MPRRRQIQKWKKNMDQPPTPRNGKKMENTLCCPFFFHFWGWAADPFFFHFWIWRRRGIRFFSVLDRPCLCAEPFRTCSECTVVVLTWVTPGPISAYIFICSLPGNLTSLRHLLPWPLNKKAEVAEGKRLHTSHRWPGTETLKITNISHCMEIGRERNFDLMRQMEVGTELNIEMELQVQAETHAQ